VSRGPQLNREVPEKSVEKFEEWCNHEGHVNGGDKGRHAEQAIIEYLPPKYRPDRFRDDLDELETNLRADLDQAGLLTEDSSLKENRVTRSSTETKKVTYRIAEDVQEALEQYVYDQEGKTRSVIGEYIATALDEYRDGGQTARVRRYYEELRDGTEMISEDRVGKIIDILEEECGDRDYYNIETIRTAVEKALVVHSDEVRNDFADRVIDRLGLVSVKTSDGVYATPERAEQIVQEYEVGDGVAWDVMDKEERVDYLKEAVKARAKGSSTTGSGVDYNKVRDNIFEGEPSNDYCYKLMKSAGESPGFEYGDHNGKKMLRFTGTMELSEKADDWVGQAVKLVREFCEENEIEPREIDRPVLDNRIARVQFPDEYDEDYGPSLRSLDKVTDKDRNRVLQAITDRDDADPILEDAKEKMHELVDRSQPIADGGSNTK